MRKSLGSGGGKGMGGGSGGGGGMMRNFQRAVRAGVGGPPPSTGATLGGTKVGKSKTLNKKQPSSSPPPSNTALTRYSSNSNSVPFSSLLNLPVSASAPTRKTSSSTTVCGDDSEWEYVDGVAARGLFEYEGYVFGSVPSTDEVNYAVSALQQAIGSSSKTNPFEVANKEVCSENGIYIDENIYSKKGRAEPSLDLYGWKKSDIVYNAFHLLETEPSVKRMVVSLSSDTAIWDAVMNNEVVKELRGTLDRARSQVGESSSEALDKANEDENILSRISTFAKTKVVELLDLITSLVNNVFNPKQEKRGDDDDNQDDAWNGKVKSSFFLSIVVLLLVIMARTNNA